LDRKLIRPKKKKKKKRKGTEKRQKPWDSCQWEREKGGTLPALVAKKKGNELGLERGQRQNRKEEKKKKKQRRI